MRISDWSSDVCSSDLCRPKHSKTQAYRTCPRIALGSRTGAASAHQISRSTKCSFFDRTSGSLTNPAGHRRSRGRRNNGPERWFIYGTVRTEERRVGKSGSERVDLGGRRNIKKKKKKQ